MNFEQEIMNAVTDGIKKTISERMSGYNTPMEKMVASVMEKNSKSIIEKMDNALKSVIDNPEFEAVLKEEFNRKVAKTLLSSLEGAVEKSANAFKSDPTLKAKMVIAIQEIINKK